MTPTRRQFIAASLAACATGLAANRAQGQQRPPNVILIMADDMGVETVGAYGGTSYETPRLDELARTGMRFDEMHALPVCTPTRLAIMSGLYNSRNYIGFGDIPLETRTFAHAFRDAGYKTFMGGKWQLGGDLTTPHTFGFDEYCLWQLTRRGPNHVSRYPNPGLAINGKKVDYRNGEYGPDIVDEHIRDFIVRSKDDPFFVYYPMILPHYPFEPTPDSPDWDPAAKGDLRGQGDPKYFADMIRYTDLLVGKVVDALDELGIRDNTLVLFTCDNGTMRGLTSIRNGQPVEGGKLSSTDNGTHVPFIANQPGVVPAGAVNGDLLCVTDLFPTMLAMAGIPTPAGLELDGQNFAPVLRGENAELRDWLYMWWNRNNDPNGPGGEFARTKRYKRYHDGRFYDLQTDPTEKSPLSPESLTPGQTAVNDRLAALIAQYTRPGFHDGTTGN